MFIYDCFIRKNTLELRKKLEKYGYKFVENGVNEWRIPIYELSCICTSSGKYLGTTGNWSPHCYIDCKDNEELFFALSAIRDDSDKYQWFVGDNGSFFFNKDDIFNQGLANYIAYFPTNWHKATKEEIIEHFK